MSYKRKLCGIEWKNALVKGDFWHLGRGHAPPPVPLNPPVDDNDEDDDYYYYYYYYYYYQ